MARKKPNHKDSNFDSPTFLEFWVVMSEGLGNNRLEFNAKASVINELFLSDCLYQEHIKSLVQNTLADKHKPLTQSIDINHVLDELGEAAYSLRQDQADDLYEIELLEEIAWHISEQYGHLVKPDSVHLIQVTKSRPEEQTVSFIRNFRKETDSKKLR